MRDLAGFREAVEQYRKQVGRTEEELARELYISKGELNKRLHDYSHSQSKRTWRLQPGHVETIVATLARWGAITARKQAIALFALIDFPALAEEIDWQASPWNKLHFDASQTERQPLPVRRRIFQARDLPRGYVPRPTAFNEIKKHLLTHKENQTTAITTALRGAGGFGKTTLALALCHDPEIQAVFPDGVLWVELGEQSPRPLDVLNGVLHTLKPSLTGGITLEEAREHWRTALGELACLLVIDDAWQIDALEPLLEGGPRCTRLITTRNDQILPEEATRVWVDAMEPAEAMAILFRGISDEIQQSSVYQPRLERLTKQLGYWPLLLTLAHGMLTSLVKRGQPIEKALTTLEKAYQARGVTAYHRENAEERQRNAKACLEVSLRHLKRITPTHYDAVIRYHELAVFLQDTDIPLTTVQIYWQGTGGLEDWEAEDLCVLLDDLSLILPTDLAIGTIRLHGVFRSYLIQRAGSNLPTLHARLLDAHQQHYHLVCWADLPFNEGYIWHHLILHLCQAGRQDVLQVTLTDLWYLTRKALIRGVSALEMDLLLACTWWPANPIEPALALFISLHRSILRIGHLLRQAQTEAEMGSVLLSYLDEELATTSQRRVLERKLPRPFLTAWHPLPKHASSALRLTLSGHTNSVDGCAFSPDGQWIVSASRDGTLKVWDAATGVERLTLSGHTNSVDGCAFSPDGQWIVSASTDKTLKMWNATTGVERLTLSGHSDQINDCAFSPDGRVIVSASDDGTLKVWDATTGVERLTFSGHTDRVIGCAFSLDGRVIVSTSFDRTLKVWDAATGAERLTRPTGAIGGCAVSPDGQWIVSAASGDTLKVSDGTLKVWDAATGVERLTLSGHTASVYGCAFSPDGQWIVSASLDSTLKVWNATTGAERLTLSGHSDQVNDCAFSPDGRVIVSASDDGTLKVWDATTGVERLTLFGHTSRVIGCAFSPSANYIVSASGDFTLKVWDAATRTERFTLSSHTNVHGWNDWVCDCAVSPDGQWIVSASDPTLKVWDAATGVERLTLSGHTAWVSGCAVSPDGQWIVSSSNDGMLKVWDAATGTERFTLSGHTNWVSGCAFSPDGQWIVSSSFDGTLKVWNAATGTEQFTLRGHTASVNACTVSPDGRWIASVSYDGTLKVWNAATGACYLTFPTDSELHGCAFHPDGAHLVACGKLGVYFLRLVNGQTFAEVFEQAGQPVPPTIRGASSPGKPSASALSPTENVSSSLLPSARLVTTRNDQVLQKGAARVWVDVMKPEEAMEMLRQRLPEEIQQSPVHQQRLEALARRLGYWPLLLTLAHGMLTNLVKRGQPIEKALTTIEKAYQTRGVTAFRWWENAEEQQRTVEACLEVSLSHLKSITPAHYDAVVRYHELAVFPQDTDIPLTTLQIYWRGTSGLEDWEVEDLCIYLEDLSLILPTNLVAGTIRLHDVFRNYLIQYAKPHSSTLHVRLLGAYQKMLGLTRWVDLPQSEAYLWNHLAFHLCQSNQQEMLQATLIDLSYLIRKVLYGGGAALEADLLLAETGTAGVLPWLHQKLARISHLLRQVETEAELGGLLLSHLGEHPVFAAQRNLLERSLPRPFLVTWHPLPSGSSFALRRTLFGHSGAITGCAVSADGHTIISASWDQTLKVWDAATGAERLTLSGHTDRVMACTVGADGSFIVSGCADGTLKVWDAVTGAERLTLSGHSNSIWNRAVNSCAVSPDGSFIVSGCADGTLKVWDAITGAERLTLFDHGKNVVGCAVSADGKWIVSASLDQTLKVWDAATGAERFTLSGHMSPVWGCAVSADGSFIVSASEDRTLKVWDAITGAERFTLSGHTDQVRACAVSADGKWIVSASLDQTLKVWDAATGAERFTLFGHRKDVVGCAVSADGKWIVSASHDQTLKVWDTAMGAEYLTLSGLSNYALDCAVSADGSTAVSASLDQTLKVWDTATGTERLTLSGHTDVIPGCAVSADGKWIVSASLDQTLKVWDTAMGAERLTLSGHTSPVWGCAVSADGGFIVSASEDGTLKVWDTATGTERFTLSGHTNPVMACTVSADGSVIVSGCADGTLKVWDAVTGAERLTLSGHSNSIWNRAVNSCAVSADGSFIVSASEDQTMKVWDAVTGAERLTLSGHTDVIPGCAVSADGKWIVSASLDQTLKVWNAQTGQCFLTFPMDGGLAKCAFHPDGEHLVACGQQGVSFLRFVRGQAFAEALEQASKPVLPSIRETSLPGKPFAATLSPSENVTFSQSRSALPPSQITSVSPPAPVSPLMRLQQPPSGPYALTSSPQKPPVSAEEVSPREIERFDKFTEHARKVLRLAQEEAQRFQHNYIGTEHLLLGLVCEGEGVAAKVLSNLGVVLNNVRSIVEFIIGRGDRIVLGEIGLTPRAKKVIELAYDEAARLNHHSVDTEHLLLGLVREGEGVAAGVLASLGVNLERIRTQIIQMLNDG